jgi:hypothetical protein
MNEINCNDPAIIDSVERILDGCGVAGPMRMAYIDLVEKACKMCKETKLSLKEIAMKLVRERQRWSIDERVLMEILKVLTPWCPQ